MRVDLPDGRKYTLGFAHVRLGEPQIYKRRSGRTTLVQAITRCVVRDIGNGGTPVAEGVARCSATDRFNKERGRKIALERALLGFERGIRARFWETYLRRS